MSGQRTATQAAADELMLSQRLQILRAHHHQALEALEIAEARCALQQEAIKAYEKLVVALNGKIADRDATIAAFKATSEPVN